MSDNKIYSTTDRYGVTTSSDSYGNQWISTTNRYGETVTTQTKEGYNPYAGNSSQMPYAAGSSAPVDRGKEKTQKYFTDNIRKKYKPILWVLFVLMLLVLPRKPLLLLIVFAGLMLLQHVVSLDGTLFSGFMNTWRVHS